MSELQNEGPAAPALVIRVLVAGGAGGRGRTCVRVAVALCVGGFVVRRRRIAELRGGTRAAQRRQREQRFIADLAPPLACAKCLTSLISQRAHEGAQEGW